MAQDLHFDNKKVTVLPIDPNQGMNGAVQLDLKTLTDLPLAQYLARSGRILSAVDMRFYDNAMFSAALPITPQNAISLFSAGIGDAGTISNNPAVNFKKSEVATNMVGDGEFEKGTTFIMEGIEVFVMLASDVPTTFAQGELQNPATTTLASYSAYLHLYAILNQFKLIFTRGGRKQPIFSGLLKEFPTKIITTGAFGNVADGFVEAYSANPNYNKLKRARVLDGQDRFSVEIVPLAQTFTPQVAFNIRVELVGVTIDEFFE